VQRLDLGTGGATRLLAGPDAMPLQGAFWYGGASFAPDGSRLAVSSLAASGQLQITTLAPDGTSPTTLTSGANDTLPAWQPRVPGPPDVDELAPDPGFEAAPAGTWAPVHQRGGRASFTWTTDPVHGGDHAVSITSSRSSTSLARWITSVPIPVRAGQALRCEGWLKAVRVAGSGRLDMTFHDRNGAYVPDSAVSSADDGQVVTGTREWTKLSFRGTAPAKAASVRIEIRLYGTGTLVADDVSLTAG
jgi:hypothetical protein